MSEQDLNQRIYDADLALQILENPVFIAAWPDLENEVIDQWKSSNSADARESSHRQLMTLYAVKRQIQQTLETGKLAKVELEHRRSMREKLGTWLR